MMDLDEPENAHNAFSPDESSGSAYEVSDDQQSHDEDAEVLLTSRAGSERGISQSVPKSHGKYSRKSNRASSSEEAEDQPLVVEDAAEWASKFKEPKLEDIKTPPRLSHGGNKRKFQKPATETRVKRLKSYYNNDYRELLNSEIQDAASRVADSGGLKGSQIGASIWTATEKTTLFTALEKLGRDDIRGIAERIGSKSQHEVQKYVNLLHQGMMERRQKDYRLLAPTDLPAAMEVGDECVAVLERAADSLAVHQERTEEKVEKTKWGDTWLINQDVATQIEKRRRQKFGEQELEEVIPAANLLNLGNWVELSDRIFMNPGPPRVENNWQAIAEPGETPAVRATAFEDFHSLAYNITKRLASTALFCSMSRLRARGSNKVKHAEVSADDVEAAVNILGLKADSHDFWRGIATRCSLQVIDDDHDELVFMTYDEVEKALRERQPRIRSRSASRARSQSRMRSEQPGASSRNAFQTENADPSALDIDGVEPDSNFDSDSEYASIPDSDEEFMSSPPPESTSSSTTSRSRAAPSTKHKSSAPDVQEVAEAAQDAHAEIFDMHTSQTEEIRLWNLLKQAPPFQLALVPVPGKAPEGVRDELAERENWREFVDYVNEWEEMDSLVADEAFARNRKRAFRTARRRTEKVEVDVDLDEDEDEDDQDENEEDQVSDDDSQHRDLVIAEDKDEDADEGSDEDQLQVESPHQHSPNY
ncbi:hypothetical protein BKA65DRAFT_517165 [Rhexocercosporidium sp. MPI-PUGE-AT-0058]|nr:hypothetical protein BKA65DRAFT_517165 [Rhexocercosporidium sp. MPI-PUGE-AT-0058]